MPGADRRAQAARRQVGEAAKEITYRDHHGRLATRDNTVQVAKIRTREQQFGMPAPSAGRPVHGHSSRPSSSRTSTPG